jgi:hypothetical protein
MQTELTIHGTWKDGTPVDVTLSKADIEVGMTRSRLLLEAEQVNDLRIDRVLLRFLYADVAGAMIDMHNTGEGADPAPFVLPISFDVFLSLSDTTGAELERAVYTLNPHWIPETKEAAQDPKGSPRVKPSKSKSHKRS